ncbi:hypothetical protein [Eubacterium pyruvativorans]|uniref:hypothetical protein n=1 Tax=Eubacterium pyruvativorans TaxID=155865 RepID=UPI000B8299A5|nr:hypothetical protein [Eubacterium pyruvativorans]
MLDRFLRQTLSYDDSYVAETYPHHGNTAAAVPSILTEYSGVKSITCPAIGNHHSGQTEISIPEMEITNILS